jgi:EAL and modified HD-GYP domain-containing signal transduction protein
VKQSKSATSIRSGNALSGVSTGASLAADVCVARQPIFRTNGEVFGYELLYRRASTDTVAGDSDRSIMAADVIMHALANIGLGQLTSGRSAFMNFTRDMLMSRAYTLIPPESVVVELLETVEPDEDVEHACEDMVSAGYTLALDDFVWSPDYRRLLELATIVKVDVLNQPPAKLDEIAQRLAPYDVRLLAERVETADVKATCIGLGYELFQGYFYARPEMVVRRTLRTDEVTIVQAMNVMRDPSTSDADAETAFSADLGLSYKLLKLVNSAARGGRGIESIRHAVQLVGRTELSKWLALLLVSSMAGRGGVNRELVHLAIQRARLCELLAKPTGHDRESGALFLVGLFSLLDAISGVPMSDLLDAVALAPALREALLGRTGPYANALTLAEAYERGAWRAVQEQAMASGVDTSQISALYVQSLEWTRERLVSLAAA